jgi:predicted kinase
MFDVGISELKFLATREMDAVLDKAKLRKHPKVFQTNNIIIKPNNTLVSMAGVSCSGKSHFVKRHFFQRDGITTKTLDSDSIVLMLRAMCPQAQETDVHNQAFPFVLNEIEQMLATKPDIAVLDSCNNGLTTRVAILKAFGSMCREKVLIGLEPPQQVIDRQMRERGVSLAELDIGSQMMTEMTRILLEIQFADPEKYFAGYDQVFLTRTPNNANVTVEK